MAEARDHADDLLDAWRRARPETDVEAMELVPCVLRLAHLYDREMQCLWAAHGLRPGWLDVLAALLRAGEPHRLSASALARSVLLSSGGLTTRIDRMVEAGLVRRRPDPDDRRGVLVELTAKGRRAAEGAIDGQREHVEPLLEALSPRERRDFVRLLRKQLAAIERRGGPEGG